MKRMLLVSAAVLLLLSGISTNGYCVPIDWSGLVTQKDSSDYWVPDGGFDYGSGFSEDYGEGLGEYIGTGSSGNYGDETILQIFIDAGYTSVSEITINLTAGLENYAGTWTTFSSDYEPGAPFVDYLVLKGGQSFSLHLYDPAAQYGTWNVGWLDPAGNSGKSPDMSFVRAYQTSTPVTEPSVLFFLGTGLVGMAGISRRKLIKK